MNIGVVGCGDIARKAYLKHASQFPILNVVACADLDAAKTRTIADEFKLRAMTPDELLASDDIELVVNLTIPSAHAEVALAAITHGKHVFSEKPFTSDVAEGRRVMDAAREKGVRIGNAPDTFLGTSHQTTRLLIDGGIIGRPVAAQAVFMCAGHERWHPNPNFYYAKRGGGPMLDMGPYYLTAMVNLLGPMERVTGIAGIQIADRVAQSDKCPYQGEKIDVETPDHVTGSVAFRSGAIASITTSFAIQHRVDDSSHPLTIFGTEGTLKSPDPNNFNGTILVKTKGDDDWREVPTQHTHPNGRSLGVADMAQAIREDRPHRATGDLAFAVLQAMEGFLTSSTTGRHIDITAEHDRPDMIAVGANVGGAGASS